ncbi:MAG: hypothetical protein AAFX54_18095 [Pseudomonadota bacterium]
MRMSCLCAQAISGALLAMTPASAETGPHRLFPDNVSTPKNELNFQVIDSEDLAIFTRAEADYSDGKIYLAKIDGDELSGSRLIGFSDARYKDSDPWLSPSGTELYFISDRPAYLGDVRDDHDNYDIWRSRRTGQAWSAPEHLSSLATPAGEFGPELNNGYLYFSSRKQGRYDIYRARIKPNGFGTPEALPAPFNTDTHDSDFTMTRDGRVALWWSTRPGGHGSGDLYVSRLTENGWTPAENLGPAVNSAGLDYTPSLSPNNAVFYFATNKPFPGQDEGAADIYKIPVKDVPVLRQAIAGNALSRLKEAFGGDEVLKSIKTLSVTLKTDSQRSGAKSKTIFIDFASSAISEYDADRQTRIFATPEQAVEVSQEVASPMSEDHRDRIVDNMTANFLYYLTADDLELLGPENIRGHGGLNWFRMRARGAVSPLVGLEPKTGRIVKVMGENDHVVFELDYLKNETGFIWPYRFLVERDGERVLEGSFSDMQVNASPPDNAPEWFAAK